MSVVAAEDRGPRIAAVDAARGVALAAMVVYHFSWDLSSFSLIAVDVIVDPGWKAFARTVAGSFIFLVGVSLVLATRKTFDRRAFLRRLAIIVGAAILVTIGTAFMFPDAYVFFGILHLIAFASVAALPFLRMPLAVVLAAAVAIFALPFFFSDEIFRWPPLWWVGLSPGAPTTSVDYVPVFPWFALTLFGIAAGRLFLQYGGDSAIAAWRPAGPAGRLAVLAGRWSLLIYLVHQPILIGLLSLVAPFAAPDPARQAATFTDQCVTSCRTAGREPPVCELYCGCVLEGIQKDGYLSAALSGRMSAEENNGWLTLVKACRPIDDARPTAPAN